jgi:glycosyltransferase involved in cell wall biosynthesis
MKVLLIGMGNRVFMPDLRYQLCKENVEAELLDFLEGCYIDSRGQKVDFGKKITSKSFIKKNLQLMVNFRKAMQLINKKSYDVTNIHFLDVRYYFFKRKLLKIADKMVVSTYGSDFNVYKRFSFLQKTFYKESYKITFANELTLFKFDKYYKNEYCQKLYICRFGLSLLPQLKQHIDITQSSNSTVQKCLSTKIKITIGYNSNTNNQHLKILSEICKFDKNIKDKIYLIFPMTYGGFNANIENVRIALNETLIEHIIFEDFLSIDELISLRMQSDIMINLPIHDQLSATMCEYLYTKNWVITGKWLPYESIDNTGVKYDRIESIDQLSGRLKDVIENLDDYKNLASQNPDKIWNFSSWEQNIKQWIDVYSA